VVEQSHVRETDRQPQDYRSFHSSPFAPCWGWWWKFNF